MSLVRDPGRGAPADAPIYSICIAVKIINICNRDRQYYHRSVKKFVVGSLPGNSEANDRFLTKNYSRNTEIDHIVQNLLDFSQ